MRALKLRKRESGCRLLTGLEKWLWVLLIAALPSLAQQNTGTILGTILDPSGAVIPGATVLVENQGTGHALKLTTNSTGNFFAPELPVGVYSVSVSHTGFRTEVRKNIALAVSDRLRLTITLQPGEALQTVTVSGGAPIVDTASTTLGRVVVTREAQDLPTNGRDLSQLLELVPGVNLQGGPGSISGQSLFSNGGDTIHLLIDGADASRVDYNLLDNTYGSSQNRISRTSIENVQEFRVYENSFSAEFGDTLGGVVNIITKSGTNEYHGDAFEFFRNSSLDARNYFDPAPQFKPPFNLNQFGGSLGGPIKRNKLFFFGNYEGIRQRTGVSLVTFVPTAAFRETVNPAVLPAVNMLPLPNGPVSPTNPNAALYSAQKSNFLDEDTAAGKLNYNLTPSKRLDFRYSVDDSLTKSVFGVAQGQTAPSYGLNQNAKLTYTDNLSPHWLNEAGVAFNRIHIDPRSSIDPAIINFPIVGIVGVAGVGPHIFDLRVANNSFSYLDTASYVQGRQEVKFGAQIIRNQDNKALDFQETETYLSLQDFANNRPFSVGTLGQPRAGMRNTYYNFFAQDDIQATRNLTVNMGLRYQYDTSPSESHRRAANFNLNTGKLDVPGSPILNAPALDFAPRIGLAYSPFRSNRTVLRAGFGLFYPDLLAADAQNLPNNLFQQSFSLNVFQDPTLQGFPFPTITQFSGVTTLTALQRNWNSPYLEAWNFTVQQELTPNSRLQIAYVGNHGLHQIGPPENVNRFFPAGTTHRPYPEFGTINETLTRGVSSYNALEVSFNRRFAGGITFNANYTYSHCLDDLPALFGSYQDDHNPMLDYGNCDPDVRHQLEFDYVYALPSVPRLPHGVGGGWQVNGITTMRTGLPFSVTCGCDPFQYGSLTALADVVPNVPRRPTPFDIPSAQINPAAYVAPAPFTWGNSGRNSLFGPSAVNFDFSLFKNFRIKERQSLQFRAEFFNIFNTPQFTNPAATVGQPGFGTSFGTIGTVDGFGTNRQIQFALKYSF